MAAVVLVDPVTDPGPGRDVGVRGGRGSPVPVGEPELVRLEVGAAVLGGEVGDPRAAAAVDAGDIAERVQPRGPGGKEGQRGVGRARRPRVALHVEVDRAAFADAGDAGLVDGVVRRFGPLGRGGRGRRAQLGAGAAARGRRLQADVGRDQAPAGRRLFGDPARGQVGLRAAAVEAADVDADRPVGRVLPGRHRAPRGRRAGVKAEAGVDRGGGEVGRRDAACFGFHLSGPLPRAGVGEDRPPAPDRVRRAALRGGRRAQVDGLAVEPHARPRPLGQADHRPALGHGNPLPIEGDGLRRWR